MVIDSPASKEGVPTDDGDLDKSLLSSSLDKSNVSLGRNIYQESRKQSNREDDKKEYFSNADDKENYGVRNTRKEENNISIIITIPRRTKILGVAAESIPDKYNACLGKNIDQESRNQLNGEDNKSEMTELSARKKCKFNKEEDGDVAMSWPEYFLNELIRINDGMLIEEEEIQLLPNQFNKELLSEYIDPKYMKNAYKSS